MTLLWPYGLIALAGVPAAILIALWRARRRELTVPSLILWDRLAEKVSDAGRKRRSPIDAAFILAAVFAAAAAFAIAGLMLKATTEPARTLLLVIDRSASMSMKQGAVTRWELAKRELGKVVDELASGDHVYLATSPPGDPVRIGPLAPKRARDKIEAMRPTDRPGDIVKDTARAMASANALSPFAAVVCTDTPRALPEGNAGRMAVIGVGGAADNIFFTRFGPADDKALIGVKNIGRARQVTLALTSDGGSLGTKTIDIDDGAEETMIFHAAQLADARWVEARIDADDSTAADNYFYAARRPEERIRVLFIGKANPFVERALEVNPAVELIRGREPEKTDDPPPYDLLVYNGAAPEITPGCSTVVIDPPNSFGTITVGGVVAEPEVTGVADLELTCGGGLAEISTKAARKMTGGASVLVDSDKGPLVIEDDKLVCVGFDISPENTRWMFTPGFVVFWAKLIGKLSPGGRAGLAWARVGEAVTPANEANWNMTRIRPGHMLIMKSDGGEFYFRPESAGIYELASGEDKTLLAFNVFDEGESSTRGSSLFFEGGLPRVAAGAGPAREVPLTPALMALAIVLAAAYWYTRK